MSPMVGSWQIEHLDHPTKWFMLSRAYLDASTRLCSEMIAGGFPSTFSHAQVVLGLCHHSVELFYKGVLHQATGMIPDGSHNLFELEADVKRVAPGFAEQFFNPFGLESTLPADDEVTFKERLGNTRDQQFRYHLDRRGQPWEGVHGFRAEMFLEELRYCAMKYDALVPR